MQNIYLPLWGTKHFIDSHLNNHGNQILLIFRSPLSDTLHNKS